ncbi:MAG: NTP transferase domain-containing protein [Melioribacteraceae bacterium]|jgi:molybdenum cofactor cytidylyltransferase|nr:NTP transferase domain-containing protein [Melioribacteraceae bacterium]
MKEISQSTDGAGLLRNDSFSITGLVIAAGLSSRIGEFKPLLQYDGRTFLENIINKLDSICDQIIVVTGHNRTSIDTELNLSQNTNKIKTVFNKNYTDGMFTSLQAGLAHANEKNWVLYHFIDQPAIPKLFYEQIISEIDDDFDWIQPTNNGKKGHPILLGGKTIDAILSSDSQSNLKQISESHKIKKKYFDTETKSIFFDVDTKDDFKKLMEEH